MKKLTLFLLMVAIACGPTATDNVEPASTITPDALIERIETALLPAVTVPGQPIETATLAERMDYYRVPAVSIAVIDGGEIAWAQAWGMADVEAGRAATTETLFQAASISKPVAATGALKLVGDGLLELDGDVNDKLSSWTLPVNEHTAESPVTLRRLLTHTAGMTVSGFPGYERSADIPDTVGVLDGAGNSAPIRVDTEPGTLWRYSGGGYTVMQQMVIEVTGEDYADFLGRTVLEPLGMSHSTYEQPLPESRWAEAASAYQMNGTKVAEDWHVYPERAAAGLWTTPSDLARWAIAVQRAHAAYLIENGTANSGGVEPAPHPVLSSELVAAMLTPDRNNQGLGPALNQGVTLFRHGGSNAGFRCVMTAYLDRGQGIVVMTNADAGSQLSTQILTTVADAYGWPDYGPREMEIVELPADALDKLTGTYRAGLRGELTISRGDDGNLRIVRPWGTTAKLLPASATEFFVADDGTPVEFLIVDGEVTGLVWAGGLRARKLE